MTKLNRSIERGLAVLEVIHMSGPSSLACLASRTGLSKPTLLRICATLENRRWLSRRGSDGWYQLGSAFPSLGKTPDLTDRLVSVAKKEIVFLSEHTGLAVDLAVAIGSGRTEIIDTTRAFKKHGVYPDTVGFRPSPILSALGAAHLSCLSKQAFADALRDMLKRLPREDAAAVPKLPSILKFIKANGYATRVPGHWGRAVDYGALPSAIAVPLMAGPDPLGAINLVWNASDRSVQDVVRDHLRILQATAHTVGQDYVRIS